jgi:hypothetical protein
MICSKSEISECNSELLNLLYMFITRWQNCVETGLQLTWSQWCYIQRPSTRLNLTSTSLVLVVSKLLTIRVVHTWSWCILKVHELETSLHVVISILHGYKSITELPIQTNWNLMVSKSRLFGIYSNSCSSTDLYKGNSDPDLMIVSVSNCLLQALE